MWGAGGIPDDDDKATSGTTAPLPPSRAEPAELALESARPVDAAAGLAASSVGWIIDTSVMVATARAAIAVCICTALALDQWVWYPFWGALGLLFMLERLVGVWRSDLRAKVVALTLIPELVYATFLNVVFLKGVVDIHLARQASWGHVVRDADGAIRMAEA